MSWYTFAWLVWLAAFIVIEGLAIRDKRRNDTLSEHCWEWFSVKQKKKAWRARRILLAAFMVWLTVHFLTGGWM